MMKRRWFTGLLIFSIVGALVPSAAFAYAHFPQDGYYWGMVTGYRCTGAYRDGNGNCLGAGGIMRVGYAAVHFVSTPTDPVAAWGSKIVLEKPIPLIDPITGNERNSSVYWVWDTGSGAGTGDGWVDVYCGDDAVDPYTTAYNLDRVENAFGDGQQHANYFDLSDR